MNGMICRSADMKNVIQNSLTIVTRIMQNVEIKYRGGCRHKSAGVMPYDRPGWRTQAAAQANVSAKQTFLDPGGGRRASRGHKCPPNKPFWAQAADARRAGGRSVRRETAAGGIQPAPGSSKGCPGGQRETWPAMCPPNLLIFVFRRGELLSGRRTHGGE